MPLIETATQYILDLLTGNEELKKFPKEFIDASVTWVKSWFLVPDDPKTNAKLEDPNKSMEVKRDIIEDKLADLQDNAQFIQELTERLAAFDKQISRLKNAVSDADIEVQGDVHIGDKGNATGEHYDEKNVIKGSNIKAGGDFRLGDDVVTGNQNVQIMHNYFGGAKGTEKALPQHQNKKSELKALLTKEKTADVIEELLDQTEGSDENNTVLLLSARLNRVNSQEHRGVITNSEAGIERNKINASLSSLIDQLSFH
jgi:hypothetical protein